MQVQLLHVCVKAVHFKWMFSSSFHLLWSNPAGYSKCRIQLESVCFRGDWRLIILLVHKCKTTKMKIEVQHCQRNADWLIVNTLTRSTSRSRRCLLSNRGLVLESTSSVPRSTSAKKRKNHTDDRREQLRRGSEDRPCTHSSIDRRRRRFLLIHSSLSGIIQSTTELFWNLRLLFVRVEPVHRAWKPKEGPLGWRRKPQDTSDIGPAPGVEWRRKASVDRNDCVWCVCVMTRCQVAQGNQNKMAKLPRTSLTTIFRQTCVSKTNTICQRKVKKKGNSPSCEYDIGVRTTNFWIRDDRDRSSGDRFALAVGDRRRVEDDGIFLSQKKIEKFVNTCFGGEWTLFFVWRAPKQNTVSCFEKFGRAWTLDATGAWALLVTVKDGRKSTQGTWFLHNAGHPLRSIDNFSCS